MPVWAAFGREWQTDGNGVQAALFQHREATGAKLNCQTMGQESKERSAMSEVTTVQLQDLVDSATHCLDIGSDWCGSNDRLEAVVKLARAELSRRAAVPLDRQELSDKLFATRLWIITSSDVKGDHWQRHANVVAQAIAARSAPSQPIPMILYCPNCGHQHIDAPEPGTEWNNPPHRSHKCHECEMVWRPSDVATTGVESIMTKGAADVWVAYADEIQAQPVVQPSAADKPVADLSRFVGALKVAINETENAMLNLDDRIYNLSVASPIRSGLQKNRKEYEQHLSELQQLKQICEGGL